MIGAILGEFWPFILAALGGLVGWFGMHRAGAEKARRKAAEAYQDTRKDIDDAMEGLPRDPDAGREWLRQRNRKP